MKIELFQTLGIVVDKMAATDAKDTANIIQG